MTDQIDQSVGLTLSLSSTVPLYRQLFDAVVDRIRSGTFPPGFRLPPSRDLASALGAHRNTVVRAYEELVSAGFLSSVVGRGTFVNVLDSKLESARPVASAAELSDGQRMPWASLLSRGASAEPLGRSDRLSTTTPPRGAINLSGMRPDPDLLPHELLRRCFDHVVKNESGPALSYAPREGLLRLRELVAKDLGQHGVPARPEDIVITTGSQQALDLIARTLVNPGDPFLIEATTYPGAMNLLSAAGARLVPIPSDGEGPTLEALDRARNIGAKGLYLMPTCHNPTGRVISAARRAAIVEWSRAAAVPIIEDDYACDLELDGIAPPPAMRALDGDVIHVGTFSKRLIPALRIGYVVCPEALRDLLIPLRHAMDLGTSLLLQHTLAEFLDRGYLRAHLKKTLPLYKERRDALAKALKTHLPASVRFQKPVRGFTIWLELPKELDVEAVYLEAKRRGVIVSPSLLHDTQAQPQKGMRLTFCSEASPRLIEGAKRLGEAFKAVMKTSKAPREEARTIDAV
ncbi:MAG: PLP-dependent aminotransferase family protein [Deltaproteobacteria bacterium]|nr:PLP-dependent aminotransferase family protein [Deltaproteobacteria bacterium]